MRHGDIFRCLGYLCAIIQTGIRQQACNRLDILFFFFLTTFDSPLRLRKFKMYVVMTHFCELDSIRQRTGCGACSNSGSEVIIGLPFWNCAPLTRDLVRYRWRDGDSDLSSLALVYPNPDRTPSDARFCHIPWRTRLLNSPGNPFECCETRHNGSNRYRQHSDNFQACLLGRLTLKLCLEVFLTLIYGLWRAFAKPLFIIPHERHVIG